jgi:hypothetical protein
MADHQVRIAVAVHIAQDLTDAAHVENLALARLVRELLDQVERIQRTEVDMKSMIVSCAALVESLADRWTKVSAPCPPVSVFPSLLQARVRSTIFLIVSSWAARMVSRQRGFQTAIKPIQRYVIAAPIKKYFRASRSPGGAPPHRVIFDQSISR